MTDAVDVDPESLTEHANAVRSFMAELQGATASASDTIDPQVWGIVNQPTAAVVGLWIDSAARFLGQVIEAGNAVAGAVDAMAQEYREQEEANKSRFQGIHASLEGGR
jgi:hypothetical protein